MHWNFNASSGKIASPHVPLWKWNTWWNFENNCTMPSHNMKGSFNNQHIFNWCLSLLTHLLSLSIPLPLSFSFRKCFTKWNIAVHDILYICVHSPIDGDEIFASSPMSHRSIVRNFQLVVLNRRLAMRTISWWEQ